MRSRPLGGRCIQGQFCVQMAVSSSTFHGTGVNRKPAAEPPTNFKISRREIFMTLSGVQSFVTCDAAIGAPLLGVAPDAIVHLHPLPGLRAQSGDRPPPDVPAVSADAVH